MAIESPDPTPDPSTQPPPATTGQYSGPLATIAAFWKSATGREPTQQEVMQWGTNIDAQYLQKILSTIQATPEAQAYAKKQQTPTSPTTTTPASNGLPTLNGRVTDPAIIKQYVASWASMPGADPSLASNPDYWVGRIIDTGGLGSDNTQYWQNAGVGDTAFFRNPGRESGGQPMSQWTAPAYQEFTPPTLDQIRAMPGYQFARDQGIDAIQKSAVAKGGLGGGTLKDIGSFTTGLADQFGQQAFQNAFATNQANNAGRLGEFGANLGAQNQWWNQGFNENINAFNQYNTLQNNAFAQWYALANLGNPGNPYA